MILLGAIIVAVAAYCWLWEGAIKYDKGVDNRIDYRSKKKDWRP